MQFIDLHAQQERIKQKIDAKIQAVLNHGKYIMGPEIRELEDRLSEYIGVKNAIGVSSGTDALLLGLMACGVGPGDAVFTSPFTFIATAEVISLLGATPIFVDIDPDTYNIDAMQLEKAIKALKLNDPSIYPLPRNHSDTHELKARGIIAVDIFGLPADFERINAIAKKQALFVIEDAAQSFGAEYKGQKACSLAQIACTSFFPAKPLGCYGDGGMCFTGDANLAEIIRSLCVHGKGSHKYDNARIGVNGRLDTLQAAILLAKFEIFPEEVERRNQAAHRYSDLMGDRFSVISPQIPDGIKSAWAQYSVLARDEQHRTVTQSRLKDAGIPTAVYYPKPLHLQTAFSSLGYLEGSFPISEDVSRRIFSIPMHPYLTKEDQEIIIEALDND